MVKPFEPFTTELNRQQVSLLLDTVLYFQDSPKLLSIPSITPDTEAVPVPLLPATLEQMLMELPEAEPQHKQHYFLEWSELSEGTGLLSVRLPSGKIVEQKTNLELFSPM